MHHLWLLVAFAWLDLSVFDHPSIRPSTAPHSWLISQFRSTREKFDSWDLSYTGNRPSHGLVVLGSALSHPFNYLCRVRNQHKNARDRCLFKILLTFYTDDWCGPKFISNITLFSALQLSSPEVLNTDIEASIGVCKLNHGCMRTGLSTGLWVVALLRKRVLSMCAHALACTCPLLEGIFFSPP